MSTILCPLHLESRFESKERRTSKMSQPLSGRTAIVTGGNRSIGRGISLHLASLGANLVLNYVSNSTEAELTASEINSKFTKAVTVRADVSSPEAVKLLFDTAEEAFGCPVHIVVQNAGVMDPYMPTIADTSVEDFDRVFNVNARGSFLVCKEAANRVVRGGGGRIVALSSSIVSASLPGCAVYTATKAAIETMIKILSKELKGTGITANCVAPGAIATQMFLEGKSEEFIKMLIDQNSIARLGKPDDIAPVVGWLCMDDGEWVNGQVIVANAGGI